MSEIAAAQPPFVNRPIRAAIIDLDGTMVDTADDFVAALNAMLARIGIEQHVTREEVTDYVGKGSENLIRSVLAVRLSPSQAAAQFDDALAIYQSEYAKVNGKHSALFPEVKEGLVAMRESGIALACVTNKPHRFAVELLAHFGIADFFKVILGGDSFPRRSPIRCPCSPHANGWTYCRAKRWRSAIRRTMRSRGVRQASQP